MITILLWILKRKILNSWDLIGKSGSLLKLNLTPFFIFVHNSQAPTLLLLLPPVLTLGQVHKKSQALPAFVLAGDSDHTSPNICAGVITPHPYLLGTMGLWSHSVPSFLKLFSDIPGTCLAPSNKSHSMNGKYFYTFVGLCIISSVMTYEQNSACMWRRGVHPVWIKLSKYLQRLFGPYLVQ